MSISPLKRLQVFIESTRTNNTSHKKIILNLLKIWEILKLIFFTLNMGQKKMKIINVKVNIIKNKREKNVK